jgi:hypothetical protein
MDTPNPSSELSWDKFQLPGNVKMPHPNEFRTMGEDPDCTKRICKILHDLITANVPQANVVLRDRLQSNTPLARLIEHKLDHRHRLISLRVSAVRNSASREYKALATAHYLTLPNAAPHPCKSCREWKPTNNQKSPFNQCVADSNVMGGSCTNCCYDRISCEWVEPEGSQPQQAQPQQPDPSQNIDNTSFSATE